MRRKEALLWMLLPVLLGLTPLFAAGKKPQCTTLQDGVLMYGSNHYLKGQLIPVGFDPYGYNYQAHLFNGSYFNAYAAEWDLPPYEGDDAAYLAANYKQLFINTTAHLYWPERHTDFIMKWNDAWLSNQDCDHDGKLDEIPGLGSHMGTGGWFTNHISGNYELSGGRQCHWTSFTKVLAVPADAIEDKPLWLAADGTEIGIMLGRNARSGMAIVQDFTNDTCARENGKSYLSPIGPGLGKFKP